MGYHLNELILVVVPQLVVTEFGIHHRLLGDTRLEPPCDLNLSLSGNTYFTPSCCCGEKTCAVWHMACLAICNVRSESLKCNVFGMVHFMLYTHYCVCTLCMREGHILSYR